MAREQPDDEDDETDEELARELDELLLDDTELLTELDALLELEGVELELDELLGTGPQFVAVAVSVAGNVGLTQIVEKFVP